jgi:hypothetical protein
MMLTVDPCHNWLPILKISGPLRPRSLTNSYHSHAASNTDKLFFSPLPRFHGSYIDWVSTALAVLPPSKVEDSRLVGVRELLLGEGRILFNRNSFFGGGEGTWERQL